MFSEWGANKEDWDPLKMLGEQLQEIWHPFVHFEK